MPWSLDPKKLIKNGCAHSFKKWWVAELSLLHALLKYWSIATFLDQQKACKAHSAHWSEDLIICLCTYHRCVGLQARQAFQRQGRPLSCLEDSSGEQPARTLTGGVNSSPLEWLHHSYKSLISLFKCLGGGRGNWPQLTVMGPIKLSLLKIL